MKRLTVSFCLGVFAAVGPSRRGIAVPMQLWRSRPAARRKRRITTSRPRQRCLVGHVGGGEQRAAGRPVRNPGAGPGRIRKLKAAGPLAKPVNVFVRGGNLPVAADAETGTGRLRHRGNANRLPGVRHEKPVVSGGRAIAGWQPYRGRIMKADVAGRGSRASTFGSSSSTASGRSWHATRTLIRKTDRGRVGLRRRTADPHVSRRSTGKAAGRSSTSPATSTTGPIRKRRKRWCFPNTTGGTTSFGWRRSTARNGSSRLTTTLLIPIGPTTAITSATCWKSWTHPANGTSTRDLDALFLAAVERDQGDVYAATLQTLLEINQARPTSASAGSRWNVPTVRRSFCGNAAIAWSPVTPFATSARMRRR